LNIAIGMQVLLGALTTGLAAALSGKQVSLKAHMHMISRQTNSCNFRSRSALLFLVCIHVPYIQSFPEDHAPGGMSTLVASYLARTRGSNEPELSITRVKDLDQFLRDCLAFKMDHGHEYGTTENGLNLRLENLRRRFEELLGNADG
jgi:hypothetical protein